MNNTEDLVIDLTFVPEWARKPPENNPYADFKGRRDGRRELGARHGDRDRNARAGEPARRQARAGEPGKRSVRDLRRSRPSAAEKAGAEQPPFAIEVAFIPERRGLKPLAARLGKSRKAYALMEVAYMFQSRPEFYAVKLEAKPASGAPPAIMHQCAECQALFLNRENALAHGLRKHFDLFYSTAEQQVEPPKGHFTCIARCGFSGELLGPPNYHGFNEKVIEMHKTRFAHLTLEEYRKKVVNDADPALIEQWKKETVRQIIYRTLKAPAPLEFKRRFEVDAHYLQHHAPGMVRAGSRFIIPGAISRELEDHAIIRVIREAWSRESRFPLKMAIAIQPAFRNLGLHIFKAPDKTAFVSAVRPHPIDPAQATAVIRGMLEYLCQHPGITRQALVQALQPNSSPDSPEVAALINPLRWLIEKGHVIEYFNGTLAVPYRKAVPPGKKLKPRAENAENHLPAAAS